MVSLINSHPHLCFSSKPSSHLTPVIVCTKSKTEFLRKPRGTNLLEVKDSEFFGSLKLGRRNPHRSSWCCCTDRSKNDEDYKLEAEILEFMETSPNPSMFPSNKDLVEAGRFDLVEAIKKKGGWFLLGWESEDESEMDKRNENKMFKTAFELEDRERSTERCKPSGSLTESISWSLIPSSPTNNISGDSSALASASASTSQPESPFGGSLEEPADNVSGIEGILKRLEMDRKSSFGNGKSGHGIHASINTRNSRDVGIIRGKNDTTLSGSTKEEPLSISKDSGIHYNQPDHWRSWSLQRAGFDGLQFEADELPYDLHNTQRGGMQQEIIGMTSNGSVTLHTWKESSHSQIQTHLQNLEMELSSAFHSLRSRNEEIISEEALKGSCNDLQTLSDALEFRENEFMHSQERLRSVRAQLAILEGKMELALKDVQKVLEEKERRIDNASKTLQLLRTTCIVWTTSATEVLLVGSFDGWTSQRKMEKSRTGVFSLYLKLYPGKYEIKFIVDGIWKTDPLRPIVHNNGHENNILTVT